jgi:hypothetical protein
MAKIYVASSWRNQWQPAVVDALRQHGHQVYDFRNPPNKAGFGWEQVALDMGNRQVVKAEELITALEHPRAKEGFAADHGAMEWADTFVMVLPCGKSAHLELGWACGKGKRTIILWQLLDTPELMYLEADKIVTSIPELIKTLAPPRDNTSWIANPGLL